VSVGKPGDHKSISKRIRKPVFEKYLPALLFILAGYFIADVTILSFRDRMLPTQPPPARPKNFDSQAFTSRGSYNTIISRNIFSSDGVIPDPLFSEKQSSKDQETPVASGLPLTLKGTIVHSNPEKSIASIESKAKINAYSVGSDIDKLATLTAVERGKIIFRNLNNNRLEFIEMKVEGSKVSFDAAKPAAGDHTVKSDVVQVAPNKFEIKRTDVLKYTNDMASILQQAATVPRRNASGEIECFKFLSIQPGSIYTQLGLQNGDCLKAVNGEKIDSPAKAMEMYQMLKNSPNIKVQLERDGRDQESDYTIK
jgi:general secretion pathway protein C